MLPLNLFYEEPDPDRWLPGDRYPRKLVRRLVRGPQRPGGVMMIALSLMSGLDRLKMSYRFNDHRYIRQHPEELACIIGKPHVLSKYRWENPIIFGAGIFSHPLDFPDLLQKHPGIRRILVPGPWMKTLFDEYYGSGMVEAWPAGIDTELWSPSLKEPQPTTDFLIYDKIRWKRDHFKSELIDPVVEELHRQGLTYSRVQYGTYTHAELKEKIGKARACIFLCEHETQGQAYQQILSTGTPVLAWDRGGFWQDPTYFPHRARVSPVSSVPYWDPRCGLTFTGATDFNGQLLNFMDKMATSAFEPRSYVVENLSLEKSAARYLELCKSIIREKT